ncbi:hypothetical protein CS078_21710 [Pseudomonas prosekii]|uniref:Uncharacterized protein n=1 Tax=Pseudomonas prosekii TaxID=1148509 RepID=A0A3L8D1E2_9PSED|nr:hypothetical protein [Pseudomonas prosekii]RLU06346.1 hypothetical protein CS078_21710 [Pseudomonas prosekii]RLU13951.1 hypothetical protein CS076_02000 [Pseudomonas prosekii]
MKSVIQAIMFACVLQMVVGAIFTTYLFNHASAGSEHYTDNALRLQYNVLQVERSQEREDLHTWIDRRIELRLSQLPKEHRR